MQGGFLQVWSFTRWPENLQQVEGHPRQGSQASCWQDGAHTVGLEQGRAGGSQLRVEELG